MALGGQALGDLDALGPQRARPHRGHQRMRPLHERRFLEKCKILLRFQGMIKTRVKLEKIGFLSSCKSLYGINRKQNRCNLTSAIYFGEVALLFNIYKIAAHVTDMNIIIPFL